MNEWTLEGVGFALAGLFQIMIAGLVLMRPSRIALVIAIAVNAALIATWAVTRTAGLPFGPNAGHRELATFIDVACVALEGAFSSRPRCRCGAHGRPTASGCRPTLCPSAPLR